MNPLLAEFNKHINHLISIYFYRKIDGDIQRIADASYSVYLKKIEQIGETIHLKFTNGMDNAGKSDFTVSMPDTATSTKETETTWKVEYESDGEIFIIKFFFPEIVKTNTKNGNNENQGIHEVKNAQGNLEKLVIETPDNGVSIEFLSLASKILSQVLENWKTFTLNSVERNEEENKRVYDFVSLESVNLPGNTFFEIVASSPDGTENIEVSTSLTINLVDATISFRLEDANYTIRKE